VSEEPVWFENPSLFGELRPAKTPCPSCPRDLDGRLLALFSPSRPSVPPVSFAASLCAWSSLVSLSVAGAPLPFFSPPGPPPSIALSKDPVSTTRKSGGLTASVWRSLRGCLCWSPCGGSARGRPSIRKQRRSRDSKKASVGAPNTPQTPRPFRRSPSTERTSSTSPRTHAASRVC